MSPTRPEATCVCPSGSRGGCWFQPGDRLGLLGPGGSRLEQGFSGPNFGMLLLLLLFLFLFPPACPGLTHRAEAFSAHGGLGRAPPRGGYFNPWAYASLGPEAWEADGWEVPGMPHASGEVESPPTPCSGTSQNSPSGARLSGRHPGRWWRQHLSPPPWAWARCPGGAGTAGLGQGWPWAWGLRALGAGRQDAPNCF